MDLWPTTIMLSTPTAAFAAGSARDAVVAAGGQPNRKPAY